VLIISTHGSAWQTGTVNQASILQVGIDVNGNAPANQFRKVTAYSTTPGVEYPWSATYVISVSAGVKTVTLQTSLPSASPQVATNWMVGGSNTQSSSAWLNVVLMQVSQ